MEKEKLDELTAALAGAGYKIIHFQMEEYSTGETPEAIGNEEKRLTGTISLRVRPVREKELPADEQMKALPPELYKKYLEWKRLGEELRLL